MIFVQLERRSSWVFILRIILFFRTFNPIQDGLFRGCSRMVRGQKAPPPPSPWNLSQIFYNDENRHNIPYLKKIKNIYESCDTPLEFCWHQHFFPEISKFCCIKNYRHRLHFDTQFLILLTFLESLNWFDKYGYNFDDISKNRYARLS